MNIYEKKQDYVKQLRHLLEAEVSEAEVIIAVRGIGKSIQEMAEKIGRLQNEDLPPLSDQARETYGPNIASSFQESTNAVLTSVMDALKTAKDAVDQSVAQMAGGESDAMVDTDMDVDVDADVSVEPDLGGDDLGLGDDMADLEGGDDLGLGDDMADLEGGDDLGLDDEPLGRAAKESVESKKRKIAEMQAMIAKAKALKENA